MKRIYLIGAILALAAVFFLLWSNSNLENSFSDDGVNKRIYLVVEGETVKDGGFNQSCWHAMEHFNLQAQVQAQANPEGKPLEVLLEQAADTNPGLIIYTTAGHSSDKERKVLEVIKKYPNIKFVVVDNKPQAELPNLAGINVESQEGAMLAGYIAGRMTRTGKVGFLGGVPSAVMDKFSYGYQAGVAYAAREQKRSLTCLVQYANSYFEKAAGIQAARYLYAHDCDIIFQAAGLSGVGAIEEAKAQKKFIIGVDVDQSLLAPGQVVTSVLKNLDLLINNVVKAYLAADDYDLTARQGLAAGATGLPVENELVPYRILRDTRALTQDIIEGKIKVPEDAASYQKFLETLK